MKWLWNKIYYDLGDYLLYCVRYFSHGLTKKLNEDLEYIDCFEYTDSMYLYMCLSENSTERYFILYNKQPRSIFTFPKMARISMNSAKYIKRKRIFTRNWILSQEEKNKLCELLSGKSSTCTKYDSVWEVINEEANLQSLNLGWNHKSNIEIPSMPDYMELPTKEDLRISKTI